jgi:hypothetical protein
MPSYMATRRGANKAKQIKTLHGRLTYYSALNAGYIAVYELPPGWSPGRDTILTTLVSLLVSAPVLKL